jgi:hypothetical protein
MAIADLTPEQLYGQMFDATTGAVRSTSASGDPAVTALVGIRSPGLVASATYTLVGTSHVAPRTNGAVGTFAFGAISASSIMITAASMEIDSVNLQASAWRVYLYNVTPPSAYADDTAWDLPAGDRASFLGYVDIYTGVDMGSTQWMEITNLSKQIRLTGTGAFGYLVNLTTLTPAAVAAIVTLHAVQL